MPVDSNSGEHAARVARAFGLKGRYHQLVDEVITPVVVIHQLAEETPMSFGEPAGELRASATGAIYGEDDTVAFGIQANAPVMLRRIWVGGAYPSEVWGVFPGLLGQTSGGLGRGYWRDVRPGIPAGVESSTRTLSTQSAIGALPLLMFGIDSSGSPATDVELQLPAGQAVTIIPVSMDGPTLWQTPGVTDGVTFFSVDFTE